MHQHRDWSFSVCNLFCNQLRAELAILNIITLTSLEVTAYWLILNCRSSPPGKERALWAATACHAETANLVFVLLVCVCRKLLGTCARRTKAGKGSQEQNSKDQHTLHPQIRPKRYVTACRWQRPLPTLCSAAANSIMSTDLQTGGKTST